MKWPMDKIFVLKKVPQAKVIKENAPQA